jgi:hypothetical protein
VGTLPAILGRTNMQRLILILTIIFAAVKGLHGQVFPDSLKNTFIAQLTDNDTIKIFTTTRSCFGGGYEKFIVTKHKGKYKMTAFMPIRLFEIRQKGLHEKNILPDTLNFKKLNSYKLADTTVIAFSKFEYYGIQCGVRPRTGGAAYRGYTLYFKNDKKVFSNMCRPVNDIEEVVIPEQYWDDVDKQDEKNGR